MNRAVRFAAIIAGAGLLGLLIVTLYRSERRGTSEEVHDVVLPEQPPPVARNPPPSAVAKPDASGIPPTIKAQILRDAGDPGAELRAVRLIDNHQEIACGEIRRSSSMRYARFVWLAVPAKVIAEENGGGAYAQVAPLCYGKGAAGI